MTQPVAPTSELIMETALELFARYSYEGTSMRQIAAAVGVKPASLYNHYPSKEELLWAIVSSAQQTLREGQDETFTGTADTARKLREFVRMHVRFHAEHSRQAAISNRHLSSLTPEHYAQVRKFRDRYELQLRRLLEQGMGEGTFHIANVRITSYAILQVGMGVSIWYRPDGPLSVGEICDAHEDLALRMVGYHD